MPAATPRPNTLGATWQRCQSLMGVKVGSTAMFSREYFVPFINQAYEDLRGSFKNGSGKNFEGLVEVLSIPGGTTSLYPWQQWEFVPPGGANPNAVRGPLFGLYDPLRLWVKSAGALPQYYTPARGPLDWLPHINPPGVTAGTFAVNISFCWMGSKLTVLPVNGATDMQVYGRFTPPPLTGDDDELLLYPDMTFVLAYTACALSGIERTNPAILEGYTERAMASKDNIVADIIRQCQKNPRRLARMGGRGGNAWGWGGGGTG